MIREGIDLLKEFEKGPDLRGPALVAYQCPAGVWTIGWGSTRGVKPGMRLTAESADMVLINEANEKETQVQSVCTKLPSSYQLAAMVCLAFNIGFEAFSKSTVLKCHNRGDVTGASRAFGLWNKAKVNGKLVVMPGLVSRRAQEAALYLKAATPQSRTLLPQNVAPEPSVGASAPVVGGVVTAGLGGGSAVLQVVNDNMQSVSGIAYSAQPLIELMRYAPIVLVVIAIGVGAYIAWRAYQRRKQGHL